MFKRLLVVSTLLFFQELSFSQTVLLKNDFSSNKENSKIETVGRGKSFVSDGVLRSKGSYVCFGEKNWENYSVSFRARAPKEAEQVQIWAGFRVGNRFDRYTIALKGGLLNELYLTRMGYAATDEFMGVRPLDFPLVPGEWYKLKVEVCQNRIRVFVNDESVPRMDIVDKNSKCAPSGQVSLGGGWIETEFDDLRIESLPSNYFDGVTKNEYYKVIDAATKEIKRQNERASYTSVKVNKLEEGRTDISLDGNWLFMPDQELKHSQEAFALADNDNDWHIMKVPSFWTPIRIWLHGETMTAANGQEAKGVSDVYFHNETKRCESYTFDYKQTKCAWYRQWVELPAEVEDKHMTLTFDAISKFSEIYINGELAGSNIGMFGEVKIDGTKFLKPGKNLIAVKVMRELDTSSENSSSTSADYFYTIAREYEDKNKRKNFEQLMSQNIPHGFYGENPGGIWQPVKLTITDPLKIEDVFIKPSLNAAEFDVSVKNHDSRKKTFSIYTDIIDKETGSVLYSGLSVQNIKIDKEESKLCNYQIKNLKPRLWTPQHPNLYEFRFRLVDKNKQHTDSFVETSGFRTFAAKNGLLELNGNPYWLRGANHLPFALAPNDVNLANTFMQLMNEGNIEVTRTHTSPWNKLWMNAADRNGLGVSYEGTWPWFMISSSPIPDEKFIQIWKKEFLSLVKKYRNHPSLLFWTINNEMYFYDYDDNLDRAKKKYRIISDVIKEMRKIDPTRPINFDSGFLFKGKRAKYGNEFINSVDNGDIDDRHDYPNWYNNSVFQTFNGEFQKQFRDPEHPVISQELATGYPNNETGHPTRSYQLPNLTPQTFAGYESYDYADPKNYLDAQSFIVGEVGEAVRRSNDKASGFMHFALLTWFRQVYDYKNIEPYSIYYALKRALQPVLVSAELWGRNYYAGQTIPTKFYVVNDLEDGRKLNPTILRWELQDNNGNCLNKGIETIPAVNHYTRYSFKKDIYIPSSLPAEKMKAKLILKLTENGIPVSENEYNLLLTNQSWVRNQVKTDKKIVLLDKDGIGKVFDFLQVKYDSVSSISELSRYKADQHICVISGLSSCTEKEKQSLLKKISQGEKILLLNSNEVVKTLYPGYIKGWFEPAEGDVVNMVRNDSRIFNDLGVMELRYFNNNEYKIPTVCNSAIVAKRDPNVLELANHMKVHNYISASTPEERQKVYDTIAGLTLFQIRDGKGIVTISTMCTEKADTDPIAGKLLINMLNDLSQNIEWKE